MCQALLPSMMVRHCSKHFPVWCHLDTRCLLPWSLPLLFLDFIPILFSIFLLFLPLPVFLPYSFLPASSLAPLALSFTFPLSLQVDVAKLNAADFGDAQSRHRIVLKGALPGVKLPGCPPPTHIMRPGSTASKLTLHDGTRCIPPPPHAPSAAHNTLQDLLLDLPLDAAQLNAGGFPASKHLRKYSNARHLCSPTIQALRSATSAHITLHVAKRISTLGHAKVSKTFHPQVHRPSWTQPAKCVTCTPHFNGRSGGDVHPMRDRYFTARELLRIQGMKDSFEVRGTLRDIYMQIGNLVPGGLGLAIAKQFKASVTTPVP